MVRIRNFTKEDANEVARLIRTTLCKVNAKYYPKSTIHNLIKNYSAKILVDKSKTRSMFVAMLKNKIVGTVQLTDDGWICAMVIRLGHQNQGIGTRLLEKVDCIARKKKFDALRAHVAINSIGFYKKLGFRIVKMVTFKEAGRTYRIIKKLR
ncbi:MAG: GNAT family N-acetyltransferase [Candidatus Micrarchaeota archaeon]